MTEAEISTIGKLIDLCRAKGCRVLVNDGFRIELGPVEEPPEKVSKKSAPPLDMCRCGHPEHQHTNGACLDGCEPQKCLPPEAK
jgi:hypothetical protein